MLGQWIQRTQRQDFGVRGGLAGGRRMAVCQLRLRCPLLGASVGCLPGGGAGICWRDSQLAIPRAGEQKTRLRCWWPQVGLGTVARVLRPAPCPPRWWQQPQVVSAPPQFSRSSSTSFVLQPRWRLVNATAACHAGQCRCLCENKRINNGNCD